MPENNIYITVTTSDDDKEKRLIVHASSKVSKRIAEDYPAYKQNYSRLNNMAEDVKIEVLKNFENYKKQAANIALSTAALVASSGALLLSGIPTGLAATSLAALGASGDIMSGIGLAGSVNDFFENENNALTGRGLAQSRIPNVYSRFINRESNTELENIALKKDLYWNLLYESAKEQALFEIEKEKKETRYVSYPVGYSSFPRPVLGEKPHWLVAWGIAQSQKRQEKYEQMLDIIDPSYKQKQEKLKKEFEDSANGFFQNEVMPFWKSLWGIKDTKHNTVIETDGAWYPQMSAPKDANSAQNEQEWFPRMATDSAVKKSKTQLKELNSTVEASRDLFKEFSEMELQLPEPRGEEYYQSAMETWNKELEEEQKRREALAQSLTDDYLSNSEIFKEGQTAFEDFGKQLDETKKGIDEISTFEFPLDDAEIDASLARYKKKVEDEMGPSFGQQAAAFTRVFQDQMRSVFGDEATTMITNFTAVWAEQNGSWSEMWDENWAGMLSTGLLALDAIDGKQSKIIQGLAGGLGQLQALKAEAKMDWGNLFKEKGGEVTGIAISALGGMFGRDSQVGNALSGKAGGRYGIDSSLLEQVILKNSNNGENAWEAMYHPETLQVILSQLKEFGEKTQKMFAEDISHGINITWVDEQHTSSEDWAAIDNSCMHTQLLVAA